MLPTVPMGSGFTNRLVSLTIYRRVEDGCPSACSGPFNGIKGAMSKRSAPNGGTWS